MRVCISIPVEIGEDEKVRAYCERLKRAYDQFEIEHVINSKYAKQNRAVIRLLFDSFKKYNESIPLPKLIKEKFPQAKVRFECFQNGGGWSNTGSCTVTAMLNGQHPEPVTTGHYCNSTHAIYWLHVGFIISMSYWNKGSPKFNGEIEFAKVNFNGAVIREVAKIRAESKEDYEIVILNKSLKDYILKLDNAIKAAISKCTCYHCREIHDWTC